MYIAAALREEGVEVRIENGDLDHFDQEELLRRIEGFSPDVVGFSATVSTSYRFVKRASAEIRRRRPKIFQVVGGGMSAAGEVVLQNTEVDAVVLGEGDVTVKEFAACLREGKSLADVPGMLFKEKGRVVRTPDRKPIRRLDVLPYPAFDLIDMQRYLIDVRRYVDGFFEYKHPDPRLFRPGRSQRMLRVPISRGCINRCSFCHRAMKGLRHFSIPYIFDYIEFLMKEFDINVFSFGDECWAPHRKWGWRFLDELKKRKLDISFQVLGIKVELIDKELLRAFREAGCFFIEYGFESGSQKMLDVMEKRTTVQQNIEAARWTQEAGLFTMPAFVLGMPGETTETIRETIQFMKDIDYGPEWYQHTFAFPVPGTPLYEYARGTGLIGDEDAYLESIHDVTPNNYLDSEVFINFTEEPMEVVRTWPGLIRDELARHYGGGPLRRFIQDTLRIEHVAYNLRRHGLRTTLRKIFRRLSAPAAAPAPAPRAAGSKMDRDRHLKVVREHLGRGTQGKTLRTVLKELHPDGACRAV